MNPIQDDVKTMGLTDFLQLSGWKHEQSLSDVSRHKNEKTGLVHVEGRSQKISVYQKIVVVYEEAFGIDQGRPESFWSTTSLEYDGIWLIDGVRILNRRGKRLLDDHVGERLPKVFREIDYSMILL